MKIELVEVRIVNFLMNDVVMNVIVESKYTPNVQTKTSQNLKL
jgi:hypothetical protein